MVTMALLAVNNYACEMLGILPAFPQRGSKKMTGVKDIGSLGGQRILITGANSGIGYSAAMDLARHGAVVVLAVRDHGRGEACLARLRREAGGPGSAADRAELIQLDLASLASVRKAAETELGKGLALHCLINNAGVMAPPKRKETADGLELQFGTNVVGHFALTGLMLPALIKAPAARVVTVASIAHKRGSINFEDLQSTQKYNPRAAYSQSKLADLMIALELDRRFRLAGTNVMSVAVHPGVAKTSIVKIGSGQGLAGLAERAIAGTIGLLLNSEAEGALPTVYAAVSKEVTGGSYYGPQGLLEARGGDVGVAKIAKQALDGEAQRRLWAVCEELSGVKYLD